MKKMLWMQARNRFVALIAAALAAPAAMAQGFPSKPIRIVVPFAAGGAVDVVSRTVGQRMSEQMKSPVVVDNRPGANANLGADLVAKAAPDGYTLLMGANGLATNVSLFQNLPFDARRDFTPVGRVGYAPLVLVVAPASPAKALTGLIALAKAQPGSLNYGSAGNGSSQHLATELLRLQTKIDVVHVPYKGGAPAITDLIGGRIAFMITNPVEVAANIKAQRLRALAVASPKRIAMLPEVPTFAEAGVPGYEASVWWGLFAPAKTPKEAVARLSAEMQKALEDAGVSEKLSALGAVVDPLGPDPFDNFFRAEIEKWAQVIKTSAIHAD
ncbi:MAG TPA: tripartite tricarboxylate transporter substrate binding protein [Burkholderiales bacterium]|nr:tripartite tricarboxylate transporter substrate binding protein [Burkholderiales bacterium]